MTAPELAQMVQIMRRDQDTYRQNMTQAARIKADHGERQVDKAVKQILADAPAEPEEVAVHFAQ